MTMTLLKDTAITISSAQAADTLSAPIAQPHKNRLVACWLMDEDSKLYWQWMIED